MPRKSTATGRHGALDEARELVALVTSLSEAGDALTPEAVSAKLGVSQERAEKLIGLVLTLSGAEGAALPLVEEDGGITLAFSQGIRGRRLRLTRSETMALVAALERLGVGPSDPLRTRLQSSLDTAPVDEDLVRRLVGKTEDAGTGAVISACSQALSSRGDLAFAYQKSALDEPLPRRAAPRRLRREEGLWYLDALDLDRGGERTFRLDRMSDVRAVPRAGGRSSRPSPTRQVLITFSDARYLDLLPWHELRIVGRGEKDGLVQAETSYYGGMWLPRMVAACAGTATTNDPEVNALVANYARSLLR